jgi:two-component system, cell cycle sensor histidine kinase and response regulator CckA
VVEDDRFVREAACELLRESGFAVQVAENAAAARTCFFSDGTRVDVLLCDAVLSDGCGVELCRQLRAESPSLRVVVTSGYPISTYPFQDTAVTCFLKKPYSAESVSIGTMRVRKAAFCSSSVMKLSRAAE